MVPLPVIIVTADRRSPEGLKDSPRVRPKRPEVWVKEYYTEAVRAAGGLPLVVPPGELSISRLLELADGVLLTGGDFDIHPSLYGEPVESRLDRVEPARTQLELALAQACLRSDVPVLGVCGGMQALAVAAGGRLIQHLRTEPLDHEQPTDDATPWHSVRVEQPALSWLEPTEQVNSTHHQAVREPGSGLVAAGWSVLDGVIEVIARREGGAFAVGVQWHPEALGDLRLYRALIEAAST